MPFESRLRLEQDELPGLRLLVSEDAELEFDIAFTDIRLTESSAKEY